MKNFKKLIKEAYLGNPLNEDIQPLAVEELTDEALLSLLNNIDDDKGKFTTSKYELATSAFDEVKRRGLKTHYVDNERYEFMESVNEVDSLNDPVMAKLRKKQMQDDAEKAKQAALDKKYGSSFMDKLDAELDLKAELEDLNHEREMIMIDMEEEAEPEGGEIADRYGERLNQIDQRIADIQEELDDLRMYESLNEDRFKKNEDSYIRITEPRFNQDPVNPNFLFVRINYDTGPGVGTALGKETMAGQIRRLSSAEAVRQLENIGRKLSDSFDLEDLEIVDLENGVVELFAVSDDFIDMDPRSELSTAMLNEEFKVGDKVTYLGHPAVVTATQEYNGRDFVSVSYDKGNGATKARMILVKSGDVKAVKEGTCGYGEDGKIGDKPAGPDLNEMEDEMLFMDRMYKDTAETSINLDDFKRTIKATYGKYAEDDDTLEAAYERFRITRPDLEEASDTDVGGGAKPNDGELDVKSSSDAALDNAVKDMGYNESKGFDFKKMVKEALTPKNLR